MKDLPLHGPLGLLYTPPSCTSPAREEASVASARASQTLHFTTTIIIKHIFTQLTTQHLRDFMFQICGPSERSPSTGPAAHISSGNCYSVRSGAGTISALCKALWGTQETERAHDALHLREAQLHLRNRPKNLHPSLLSTADKIYSPPKFNSSPGTDVSVLVSLFVGSSRHADGEPSPNRESAENASWRPESERAPAG
ncbi:hypothetical protein SKAU_G00219740 [Synaphobranchus kaupii]|uniref:Uncharacterized protein n=1 Tax=Synaphobranchus kaupii TaxID=118154 RepID=A0A9Q1IUV8_SYNKA|nr:hypothetical protein SKAU_G00219740 [Synaphobranchus kaupii]